MNIPSSQTLAVIEPVAHSPFLPNNRHIPMHADNSAVISMLANLVKSLAATSGIHRGTDALKMLMAGADVTLLCSTLMARGINHIRVIEQEMREWMELNEYKSV